MKAEYMRLHSLLYHNLVMLIDPALAFGTMLKLYITLSGVMGGRETALEP